MNSSEERAFLRHYEEYVIEVLKPTEIEIKRLLDSWTKNSYWDRHTQIDRLPSPSPIQFVKARIKRPESALDKIFRKPEDFPDGVHLNSVFAMTDAVAGRVVVYFLANLIQVHREIITNNLLEVSTKRPPIAYLSSDLFERLGLTDIERKSKDSGYASLHYVVRFRDSSVPKERRPWFEIQVRTIAEHMWGEIEHILGYKPDKRTSFAVKKQFQIIGSQLTSIDEHFNLLFEELSRFQQEVIFKDSDPLNAENLPAVLNDMGIGCAQREIDGLLKLLNSRGIETVKILNDVATPNHLEKIRNTYRSSEGRTPDNFEVVASLASIYNIKEEDKILEAIKTQIEFLKAWTELKNLFPANKNQYPSNRD